MSLTITEAQELATDRRTLYGAVYLLSGTLLSRVSGVASVPIRWGTRTFSGGPSSEVYEAYLGPPAVIEEELAFKLGEATPNHPVNIPVRNLPFRHTDSLLASIVDEEFAWEGSQATLYVGYLQPGQEPGDLAPEDWTSLRKGGVFGAPQDIQQDGFTLPLFSRDALRRQVLDFHKATSTDFPNIDPLDEGRVIPVIIGAPDSWIRMVRVNAGVYGFTTRSTLSGTVSGITIQSNFSAEQVSGLSGAQVYLHRQDKVLTVQSVEADPAGVFNLVFTGGLIGFNIPQGALVQEKLPYYEFLPSANDLTFNPFFSPGQQTSGYFAAGVIAAQAFETYDGRIIPFQTSGVAPASGTEHRHAAIQYVAGAPFQAPINPTSGGGFVKYRLLDALQPPALIPRLNLPSTGGDVSADLDITAQPEFTPSVGFVSATKLNVPTGPGAAAAAFDGSQNTGYSLGAFGSVTFTFPSVTGGTFQNTDTVRSILRFTSQGILTYSDGLNVFHTTGAASKDTYTIVLGSPENFNQSVLVTAGAGGGIVYEIAWEHELEATLTVDRTTDVSGDVNVTQGSAEDVGFDMVPIRGILLKVALSNNAFSSFAAGPWNGPSLSPTHLGYRRLCLPTAVFSNLQLKYLEGGLTDLNLGRFEDNQSKYEPFIDVASYAAAELEYIERNIRFNFAITEPIAWADLERELAAQCRSYAFFGPNGHQLIVMKTSTEVNALNVVEAEFFLPGTPRPNTAAPSGPLIERTPLGDIFNRVQLNWGRQWHLDSRAPVEERYLYLAQAVNTTSQGVFGDRFEIGGNAPVWAVNSVCVDGSLFYDLEAIPPVLPYSGGLAQVLDLADFIADRQGFARTRFVFETGWRAFRLTQGSLIRVSFAVAPGVYRNVVCEVEDIQTSPINAERRSITARSVGTPQHGLSPSLVWTDLFTGLSDTWADRFTSTHDRWETYFGVPE